ncbi:MAG: M48 family metalloprotease [Coriobacteriia bacterium]|nr:M48 family metalloprotease [Coriobacteriia bacterium]
MTGTVGTITHEELIKRFQPLPERIKRNRRRTAWFMMLYVAISSFLVAASVVLGVGLTLLHVFAENDMPKLFVHLQEYSELILVGILAMWLVLMLLFLGSSWLTLRRGEGRLLAALKAKPAPFGEYRAVKSALYDVAIATGVPLPRLAIIKDRAINAFAISHRYENGWVGVTTGLVDLLTAEELRCVLAHLVARLQDGSARAATILSELLMAEDSLVKKDDEFARLCLENPDVVAANSKAMMPKVLNEGEAEGKTRSPFSLLFASLHFVTNGCSRIVIWFIKSWYCRQQSVAAECADAMAVSITKDPASMVRALSKVLPVDNRPGDASEPRFREDIFGALFFAWPTFSFADDPELVRIQRLREILGPAAIGR